MANNLAAAQSLIGLRAMARAAGPDSETAATIADLVLAENLATQADVLSAHRLCDRVEELVAESP